MKLQLDRLMLRAALCAVPVLALTCGVARAELFPDNEARKAIVELREKTAADQNANNERLDKLSKQIDQQNDLNARSQLDNAQQIESLKRDIAALRGAIEVMQKNLADLQTRQRDVFTDIDSRLKKQEPQKVTIEGRETLADPEQIRAYNAAFEQFRASKFNDAAQAFAIFVTLYPTSPYTPLARFWLGNSQYATRDFKSAIITHQAFVKAYPDSPRVPDALVSIGNSQVEINDKKAARITFRNVIDAYPGTPAAENAKERLAAIK